MLLRFENVKRWLLPVFVILFILQVITLPWVVKFTYAGRSESPQHIITYTQNSLDWEDANGVDANGVYNLKLFSNEDGETVLSEDGDKVVAPGTTRESIVRLKNDVKGAIKYTAVAYIKESIEELPVEGYMNGEKFADTTEYMLPEGVNDEHVIRAVTGTVGGGQIQDFDLSWVWEFYESDEQDVIDTWLGNGDVDAETVTMGFYLYVEDDNIYTPNVPETGDHSLLYAYIALMGISALVIILLIVERKLRERKTAHNKDC